MPLKVLLSLNAFNVPCSDKNIIKKKCFSDAILDLKRKEKSSAKGGI